jgi:hypothetical protein
MPLKALPTELWAYTFSFFNDPQDMVRMCRVSTRFYNIVHQSYFDPISTIHVISNAEEREGSVTVTIHSKLFVGPFLCDPRRIVPAFRFWWKKAINLNGCLLEGYSPNGQTTQGNPRRLYVQYDYTTFIDIMRDIYTICKNTERKITQFECIPQLSFMPASRGNSFYFRSYYLLATLWKNTLKTVAVQLESEFMADWIKLMKGTSVENFTIHFPKPLNHAYPVLTFWTYLDPITEVFKKLKELFHQPGRTVKQFKFFTPTLIGTDHEDKAVKEYQSLLIGMAPTVEFHLDHPLEFNFSWETFLTEHLQSEPVTPFQQSVRTLHLGPRISLISENLREWPYRKLFPNLLFVNNAHFTHTMVDSFIYDLKSPLRCVDLEPRTLFINCQPISNVGYTFLEGLPRDRKTIEANKEMAQYEEYTNDHSCLIEIRVTITCRSCPKSSKHTIQISIPIRHWKRG